MTDNSKPSTGQWRTLINAANAFRKLEPWKLYEYEQVFGVQHPEGEDILYCTILGMLGEVLGLGIYPGQQGLQSYYQMAYGLIQNGLFPPSFQAMLVSFESKKDMDKKELRLFKKLGYSFRGPKKWPQFQVYTAQHSSEGLWPDAHQAKQMNIALQAALEVVHREYKNQSIFYEPSQESDIIPLLKWSSSEEKWGVEYSEQDPKEKVSLPQPPDLDQVRLQRLISSAQRQGIWEGSVLQLPAKIELDQGESYAPPMGLWAEHGSYFILGFEIGHPGTGWELIVSSLIQAMEKNSIIPQKILVDNAMARNMLSKLTTYLHIEISQTETLPAITDVFQGMKRDIFSSLK